jgi:rubrerythrin
MNDIEKAIEVLKMENELMQFDPMTGEIEPLELQNQDNQDLYKANLIAISALEKQIPKKPKQYTDIFKMTYYFCPICEYVRITGNQKRCDVCGQKIDWEVENE